MNGDFPNDKDFLKGLHIEPVEFPAPKQAKSKSFATEFPVHIEGDIVTMHLDDFRRLIALIPECEMYAAKAGGWEAAAKYATGCMEQEQGMNKLWFAFGIAAALAFWAVIR